MGEVSERITSVARPSQLQWRSKAFRARRLGLSAFLLATTLILIALASPASVPAIETARQQSHEPIVEFENGGAWIPLDTFVTVVWPRDLESETGDAISRLELRLPDEFSGPPVKALPAFRIKPFGTEGLVMPVILLAGRTERDSPAVKMNLLASRNLRDGWVRVNPSSMPGTGFDALRERLIATNGRRDAQVSRMFAGVVVRYGTERRFYPVELTK